MLDATPEEENMNYPEPFTMSYYPTRFGVFHFPHHPILGNTPLPIDPDLDSWPWLTCTLDERPA